MRTPEALAWILLAGAALLAGGTVHAATLMLGAADTLSGESNIRVPVTLTPGKGESVAAIQFDLHFDVSRLRLVSVNTGAAASAAGKSASSYALGDGKHRIIVIGMNQNILGQGSVIELLMEVIPNTPPGVYPLTMTNVVFSNPVGMAIKPQVVPGSITVGGPAQAQTPLLEEKKSGGGCFGGIVYRKGPGGSTGDAFLLMVPLLLLLVVYKTPTSSLRLGRGGLTPQTMWTSPRQPYRLAPRNDATRKFYTKIREKGSTFSLIASPPPFGAALRALFLYRFRKHRA